MKETANAIEQDIRSRIVEVAKRHKSSWLELGQYLYGIYKDKLYRNWGFLNFESYCHKELNLKQTTAVKLLKSYYFVEQEEPRLLKVTEQGDTSPRQIPSYDSVDALRLAKTNKKLSSEDFTELRKAVLNEGKEVKDVKAQVKKMVAEHEERSPGELRKDRRNEAIRRLARVLAQAKLEFGASSFVPPFLLKQMDDLVVKLQDQLE